MTAWICTRIGDIKDGEHRQKKRERIVSLIKSYAESIDDFFDAIGSVDDDVVALVGAFWIGWCGYSWENFLVTSSICLRMYVDLYYFFVTDLPEK